MPDSEMTAAEQEACEEALKRIADCVRRRGVALDLSGLKLTRLPGRITQIPKLTELNLSHNLLAILPLELLQFTQLARLDLSHNPLASLPPEIARFTELTLLDLSHNPLATLPPEIGRLAMLTRLELSHCALATLPPEIGQLAKLTRFYLSNNRLASLPPEIARLASLTRLDLSHNRLETLPPEIGQLAKLTVLRLMANRLAALPDSLANLEALESLFLHDNPALQLSPSVLGVDPRKPAPQGKSATAKSILEFHFARMTGKSRPLNEVKLVLVGRSGVGKTTMVQALREMPFRETEAGTTGVACCEWTMDGCAGSPVTVHVWDFSGQEITRALHPYFFSERSLYVVVLAGGERHERDDAEYWLRLIQESATDPHGDGPPVLVAMNQWNVPGCRPEVDRIMLRERYPFIRGFVEMDCKVKKGIPALKAALCREVDRQPSVREPVTEEWDAVRRALAAQGRQRPYLTQTEYRRLCVEHGVTDEGQQDYLAEILHQLGIVLNFRNDPRLNEEAVIQPEWLTKHAYALLHRSQLQAGMLHQTDVDMVMFAEKDETMRANLLRIMQLFGIIHATQAAGGVWLVPRTLPETAPAGMEVFRTDADAIRLRFTYPALPEGLLLQLAARRFDFIEEVRERRQLWRDGLVLTRKGARVLIRMEPQLRQMTLIVIGPTKTRRQLADLCLSEMREIHSSLPGPDPIGETYMEGEWITLAPPEDHQTTNNS